MLPALLTLCALGMAMMVSLRDPLRDVLLVVPFAQGTIAGVLVLLAASLVDLERSLLPRLSYVPLALALILSLLLVTIGSGPTGSDARVNLFGVQPVDTIRLLVTLFPGQGPSPGDGKHCASSKTPARNSAAPGAS